MLIKSKVIYTPSFLEDFYNTINNTSKYSTSLSQKIKKEFYSKISYLQEYPKMYQVIKIINKKEIRKFVIKKYVVLYSINNNIVNILNIYPQKSNYINLIKI